MVRAADTLLWLRDNRTVEPGSRWIVEGRQEAVHHQLALSTQFAGEVLEWIVRFIKVDAKAPWQKPEVPVLVLGNGEVLVQSTGVVETWNFVLGRPPPSAGRVGRALKTLSVLEDRKWVERHQSRFWSIRPEVLLMWAEKTGMADVTQLRACIERIIP